MPRKLLIIALVLLVASCLRNKVEDIPLDKSEVVFTAAGGVAYISLVDKEGVEVKTVEMSPAFGEGTTYKVWLESGLGESDSPDLKIDNEWAGVIFEGARAGAVKRILVSAKKNETGKERSCNIVFYYDGALSKGHFKITQKADSDAVD